MNSVVDYIQNAYQELAYKVTWPTLSELQSSAVLVIVASLIIALIIWAMDISASNIATTIYNTLMSIGG
jgi:preprotein translocase subunit SecE